MYKCLIDTVFYSLTFKAGEVYDIDEMLASRLLRAGRIEKEPAKEIVNDDMAVEQPETLEVFKPVATAFEPLPEIDDLAKPIAKPKNLVGKKR